jgi:hypothetical protein
MLLELQPPHTEMILRLSDVRKVSQEPMVTPQERPTSATFGEPARPPYPPQPTVEVSWESPQNPQNPQNPQYPQNPQNPQNPQDPQNPQNPQYPQKQNPQNPQKQNPQGFVGRLRGRLRGGVEGTDTDIFTPYESREPRRTGGNLEDVVPVVAGLIGLGALGARFLVKARTGGRRTLRVPTSSQTEDIGRPIGRILIRHFDMTRVAPDFADLMVAGHETATYLDDGTLMPTVFPENVIPEV